MTGFIIFCLIVNLSFLALTIPVMIEKFSIKILFRVIYLNMIVLFIELIIFLMSKF